MQSRHERSQGFEKFQNEKHQHWRASSAKYGQKGSPNGDLASPTRLAIASSFYFAFQLAHARDIQRRQELLCQTFSRNDNLWRDLQQGQQYKRTFVHARMRDGETALTHLRIVEQEDVQIECSRAIPLFAGAISETAVLCFDRCLLYTSDAADE